MKKSTIPSFVISVSATMLLVACDTAEQPANIAPTEEVAQPTEVAGVAETIAQLDASTSDSATISSDVVASTRQLEKPVLAANTFSKLTATVVSIDLTTREVLLRDSSGNEEAIIVSEEARNLERVAVGGTVVAEVMEQVSVYLVKDSLQAPMEAVAEVQSRAQDDDMPSASKIQRAVAVYTLAAINTETNSFTLQDVTGAFEEYSARDPKNLSNVSVGDRVVIETSTISAVKVVKAE